MKCYYCDNETQFRQQTQHTCWCQICENKFDLEEVLTTFNDENIVQYSCINIKLPSGIFVATVWPQLNRSAIVGALSTFTLMIPGCPFTTANVKNKIKLYLLFS
jgi:hypothetical protein